MYVYMYVCICRVYIFVPPPRWNVKHAIYSATLSDPAHAPAPGRFLGSPLNNNNNNNNNNYHQNTVYTIIIINYIGR